MAKMPHICQKRSEIATLLDPVYIANFAALATKIRTGLAG